MPTGAQHLALNRQPDPIGAALDTRACCWSRFPEQHRVLPKNRRAHQRHARFHEVHRSARFVVLETALPQPLLHPPHEGHGRLGRFARPFGGFGRRGVVVQRHPADRSTGAGGDHSGADIGHGRLGRPGRFGILGSGRRAGRRHCGSRRRRSRGLGGPDGRRDACLPIRARARSSRFLVRQEFVRIGLTCVLGFAAPLRRLREPRCRNRVRGGLVGGARRCRDGRCCSARRPNCPSR